MKSCTLKLKCLYFIYGLLRPSGPGLLFWVPGGLSLMLHVESAIAAAMMLRGVKAHAVICDGTYRACVKREFKQGDKIDEWSNVCNVCIKENKSILDKLGIKYSYIGDYVDQVERKNLWSQAQGVNWDTLNTINSGTISLEKNIRSSIVRYQQGCDIPITNELVQEYAYSALVCAKAANNAIDSIKPTRVIMSHGGYVDWGPALLSAVARGIKVCCWKSAYLTSRFFLRNVEDGINKNTHSLSHKAWEKRSSRPLSMSEDRRLDTYIEDRYKRKVSFDMKNFKPYSGDRSKLVSHLNLLSDKPVWGIMSHIVWDAVYESSQRAYGNFNEWILDTLKEIFRIDSVQWVIKLHPNEAFYKSSAGVESILEQHSISLPPHVHLITAKDDISPLDFFNLVNGGVTVHGTSGLELALLGKPVILTGKAHYGGKGFTYDGLTPELYREYLKQAPEIPSLSDKQRELARRYAYCYFIQRQIPLPVVKDKDSKWWNFQFDKLHLLNPGKEPFMDFICDRIIDGEDFVMDEPLINKAEGF